MKETLPKQYPLCQHLVIELEAFSSIEVRRAESIYLWTYKGQPGRKR